ncbi:hypothetical protein [Nocardia gipuzkoensis]
MTNDFTEDILGITDDHVRDLHTLLTARGWSIQDYTDPDENGWPENIEAGWCYPGSYGGEPMNLIDEVTPEGLTCQFNLEDQTIEVDTPGNYGGCDNHMAGRYRIPIDEFDLSALRVLLDDLEPKARALDPRVLIECRFFGPCGQAA